ncbi:MAG: hypothetical protein MZV64_16650 [Ignavibacteriales bacterium]|nr:hypothetical protein [Ignavibacteriales bacterium]
MTLREGRDRNSRRRSRSRAPLLRGRPVPLRRGWPSASGSCGRSSPRSARL